MPPAVVAFAGRDAANLGLLAGQYGVPRTYTDWRAMLTDADVEVVHIVTPPDKHAEMAVAALEAGKHVFVEKPLATTDADARTILAAADRAREAGRHQLRPCATTRSIRPCRPSPARGGWGR